ncbi:MAG: hypothetical protein RR416_02745 [Clostridia bacterium]
MTNEYNSKAKTIKKFFMTGYATRYARCLIACNVLDPRVQAIVAKMPEGFDLCVDVFGHHHLIVLTKLGNQLSFKFVDDYVPSDCILFTFKNLTALSLVQYNQMTFVDAFNQGRIVVSGNTGYTVDFMQMLMIAQSYTATSVEKKNHKLLLPPTVVSKDKLRWYILWRITK